MTRAGAALTPERSPSEIELMELHLRCLYTHDAVGRIGLTREPGGGAAARFHLGRTRLGNLWRFRSDLSADDVRALARLAAREAPLEETPRDAAPAPPERLEPMRRVLGGRANVTAEWAGPAYDFPVDVGSVAAALEERATADARIVAVDAENAEVLEPHFAAEAAQLALRAPCIAALVDGCAVSLCQAARPLGSWAADVEGCAASEASLETVASHRGRGLAPRVVAAWGAAVRELGGVPLYSTSWQNTASRAVASKVGLRCYGEDVHLT